MENKRLSMIMLLALVLIAGWAVMKMLAPDMILEVLRATTFC